jgi:hypothetical protein
MYSRVMVLALSGLAASVGLAQGRGIVWRTDVPAAIQTAQQTHLPLMFWILGRNEDRDNNLENEQKRAFADPLVLRRAQRFVTVRLSRSVHRDILEQLGISPSTTLEVAFATPDGKLIDKLSASGVARPQSLAEKMRLVFNVYRQQLFTGQLQPLLEKQGAAFEEVRDALETIRNLNVTAADAAVIGLLERPGLDKRLVQPCLETLARLSTKAAVDKLVELTDKGNLQAGAALAQCTPGGAEHMLAHLVDKEGGVRLEVYEALVKVCEIKSRKVPRWWERAEPEQRQKEVDRVSELVRQCAGNWKEENDE